MRRPTIAIAAGAVLAAVLIGAGAAAVSASSDDDSSDTPITGPALDQATAAALAHLGGGRVTGTEVGDEEGHYEVEVTLDDGSQVDVHLDREFGVVGSETDGPGDDIDS